VTNWLTVILLILLLWEFYATRKVLVASFNRREQLFLQLMRQVRDPETGYHLPPL
jgi:hypothetical protein